MFQTTRYAPQLHGWNINSQNRESRKATNNFPLGIEISFLKEEGKEVDYLPYLVMSKVILIKIENLGIAYIGL